MRKVLPISLISWIFTVTLLCSALGYAEGISFLRIPLYLQDNGFDSKRRCLLTLELPNEPDKSNAAKLNKSFMEKIEGELSCKAWYGSTMYLPLWELFLNTMVHGKGGTVTVSHTKDLDVEEVKLVCIDRGQGMDKPDGFLEQSKRVHQELKLTERVVETGVDEFGVPMLFYKLMHREEDANNLGFWNIVWYPDIVKIESRGKAWVRKGKNLEYNGFSDVKEGVRTTLVWIREHRLKRWLLMQKEKILHFL